MALRWTAAGMREAQGLPPSKAYRLLPILRVALVAHAAERIAKGEGRTPNRCRIASLTPLLDHASDSTVSTDQRGLQAIAQGFSADGFAQECDSTGRQYLCARRLVGKTRNKNCRYGEAIGEQTSMELNPVKPGMCRSIIRQEVSVTRFESRKSSADE
jgi:hypothetical protein